MIEGIVEWHDDDSNDGTIVKTAIATIPMWDDYVRREVVGYNDILRGDYVMYEGEKWRVVMVSRLGDFGLSKTDDLPYTIRVSPDKVQPIKDGDTE